MKKIIDAAVSDLQEALLVVSDGTTRVESDTLRDALLLLMHGTDGGEFFDGFNEAFNPAVSQVDVSSEGVVDLEALRDALSERFQGRRVSFVLVDPRGRYVANVSDHVRSNALRAVENEDGTVTLSTV